MKLYMAVDQVVCTQPSEISECNLPSRRVIAGRHALDIENPKAKRCGGAGGVMDGHATPAAPVIRTLGPR
eukprot:1347424-Rhodomonas_salina.2